MTTCLVVLAVIYLVYAVSHPIAALVDYMHRVANNGIRIDTPGVDRHDEIGDIAQAVARFHEDIIELGHSKDALITQAVVLRETLDKERRMTELQRDSISMTSHEFRTPLDVIDSQAQRLTRIRDALPLEVLEERYEKIRTAVQHVTHLMDHLLDSSHWLDSTTPAATRRTDFPPAALLTEVYEVYLEDTPSARIELCVGTDESNTFFDDARLLFQTFNSLVGNAVKYSPPSAPANMRMRSDGSGVLVTVEGRGPGIPKRDIERPFECHVRGGDIAGTVGAGVGLYLVKLVVGLHRGTITVTNEEGKDSTSSVFLPRLKSQFIPAGSPFTGSM